jgi:hypothetical protein
VIPANRRAAPHHRCVQHNPRTSGSALYTGRSPRQGRTGSTRRDPARRSAECAFGAAVIYVGHPDTRSNHDMHRKREAAQQRLE